MGSSSGSSDEDNKPQTNGFRIGGGVGVGGKGTKKGEGAFSAYMAGKNQQVDPFQDVPLPDSMKTITLMELIFCERNWPQPLLMEDVERLEYNRLFTVSDLRVLSKESWKSIDLLPIVKDLLQAKIYNKGGKVKKVKKYKREETSDSSELEPTEPLVQGFPKLNLEAEPTNSSLVGKSTQPPGTIQAVGNKIQVSCSDGKVYEAARYCPHKGVDLAGGWVNGTNVVCPKHKWEFNLATGGRCTTKSKYSLHACQLDW